VWGAGVGPRGCARASAGSPGGGCSAGLVCWKGRREDEPAGRVVGASPLSQPCLTPSYAWSCCPIPGGSLGSCPFPALPQGRVLGDGSSLPGWRMGPKPDPGRWAGAGVGGVGAPGGFALGPALGGAEPPSPGALAAGLGVPPG